MPGILSKNCVLAGEVECYCLVCCELLPAEHDVLAHIQLASHEHILSSHAYLHKFQRDCIRKVAGVYFCEFCNTTLPTAAKVSLHVTELTHVERRRARMLTRGDNCIVFNENIKITENAWNGLVDDTCVLCNAEFEDESVHKSEQNHILNLIRSRVTIGDNNDVYRQVEGFYQCLTCNKVVAENAINDHLDTVQHKGLLTNSAGTEHDDSNVKSEKKNVNDGTEGIGGTNRSTDNDSANDVHNNGLDDKRLFTQPDLKKTNAVPVCSTAVPLEVISLANQHGMTIMKNRHKLVFCNTCEAEVAATLNDIKQHVAGRKHTEKLTKLVDVKKGTPAKPTKMLIRSFINDFELVEIEIKNASGETVPISYVLVNNSFLLRINYFYGIAKYDDILVCNFCAIGLTPLTIDMHLIIPEHYNILDNCFIITSLPREFIRQLKTDLYDCAYCGHVERSWEDMLKHLDTDEHKRCRDGQEKLLIKCKPALIECQVQNMMPFNLSAMMNSKRQFS